MGNPHLVIFVNDIEAIDLTVIGPKLENHPLFPGRLNVEFAQILGEGKIRMRVWERGSGITQACGTGACATAVAAFPVSYTHLSGKSWEAGSLLLHDTQKKQKPSLQLPQSKGANHNHSFSTS